MHKKQVKKDISKEILEIQCKLSHNFTELQDRLGYKAKGGSRSTTKRLTKYLILYNIDYSHFDSFYKLRLKRIHPIIVKECPICHKQFKEAQGSSREKTYCSKKCANKLNIGNRRSSETNLKVSLALRGRTVWKKDETGQLNFDKQLFSKYKRVYVKKENKSMYKKECEFCHKVFYTDQPKRMFCNRTCQMKGLWLRDSYRNKVMSSIEDRVKSGEHQGWTTRNVLSYPEKFFKKVLESSGYKDKFITNHPVRKRGLGLDCDACYFLDFYFPELKLDLEIDGKQHKYKERIISDENRDIALNKNGYRVYRIEWKSLNKPEGKEFVRKEIENFLEYINNLKCGEV